MGRRAYYIYCPSKVTRLSLLKLVAQAAGTPSTGDCQRVIRNLRFDLAHRRVLLVFDEAQHLDVECLETVRELYDLPPHFGLLFAGSHQLERLFTLHSTELEQWNSRFKAGRRLPGISKDEAIRDRRRRTGDGVRGTQGAEADRELAGEIGDIRRKAGIHQRTATL